ncbi:hypothetical protein JQ596_30270 [Bradyrhizobium manausense]|uniref:hypothetical protein n=1 Tax=Bradyrhizobium TaxID=374 RepID=UPI001BA73EAA|nr:MULTISPECIES: hypothetical protein [Bradyrhizobium]MBR0829825.1 hypothetical protein [Bradyrhizobium manausense]UVO25433.1 hypothetical protein KUF59_22805 [Bradyrhizobium arachidis]
MAVEMIGGPRLREPLLATGLGRFNGAASRHDVQAAELRRQRTQLISLRRASCGPRKRPA